MISGEDPSNHLQMVTWNQHLPESMHSAWTSIFSWLFKSTNNFILIQHHFKMLYRIATSRYLRFKMKIENNPHCQKCGALETLEHIYIYCPNSLQFIDRVHDFIRTKLDNQFADREHITRFSCSHSNTAVTFLLLVCNWYIGRQYQKGKDLYWDPFVRYTKQFLIGEKHSITNQLKNCIQYSSQCSKPQRLRQHLKGKATGPFFLAFPFMSYIVSHSFSILTTYRFTPGSRLSNVVLFYCQRLQVNWFFSGHLFFPLFLVLSFSFLSFFHIFVTTLSHFTFTTNLPHYTCHQIHNFTTKLLQCQPVKVYTTTCRCSMTCGKEITAVQ